MASWNIAALDRLRTSLTRWALPSKLQPVTAITMRAGLIVCNFNPSRVHPLTIIIFSLPTFIIGEVGEINGVSSGALPSLDQGNKTKRVVYLKNVAHNLPQISYDSLLALL